MNKNLDLQITSWNVRGLRKLAEVKQVMSRIKQYHPKIVFLQETHLLSNETGRLKKRWPGQVITCSFSSHARGIAVLVHKSVPLRIQKIILDPAQEIYYYTSFVNKPRLDSCESIRS